MKISKKITYVSDDGFEFLFKPIEDTLTIKKVKNGFEARYLVYDEDAENPDDWGDDMVFLVNYHRDFYVERPDLVTKEQVISFYRGEDTEGLENKYFVFELSCLVHSGVWLSLSRSFMSDPQGWDTSHVGVVLVDKREADSEEKALRLAKGLVESWNQYLSGDVYLMVLEKYDKDKIPLDYDVVGGVYGIDYAIEELKHFED